MKRWGLQTLGDLAALPPPALSERLGQAGLAWQRLARGEDARPLVPDRPEERFEASVDLDWPIDGLEPLSFVVGRLCDAVCARLVQADCAAGEIQVRLRLVTRDTYTRRLHLPAPIGDPRALRTVAMLDLEMHPAPAAIEGVTLAVEPAPRRIVQHSLIAPAEAAPEHLSTLLARLAALMGEGRCGAATLVDSHEPGAFEMAPFDPGERRPRSARSRDRPLGPEPGARCTENGARHTALRRFRPPIPARVALVRGRPVHVTIDRHGLDGGRVETCAGPWRTSGAWWRPHASRLPYQPMRWNRDEWDIALSDGGIYRLYRDRDGDRWCIEAMID